MALASVALQFPNSRLNRWKTRSSTWECAAPPLEERSRVRNFFPKFDPFWAKAEEMQALIFMHPQDSAVATGVAPRVQGNGFLDNVIGNPLETTIFLSHLIFEGTLDKFPT